MSKKPLKNRSRKDLLIAGLPILFVLILIAFAYRHLDPAPPDHLTISTGDGEGDYQVYAKLYADFLKQEGIKLEIVSSEGPLENLKRLEDDHSGVSVGFAPDGLGTPEEQPDVVSLGSMYYEPLWVFYRGKKELTHFSELEGQKIAIGRLGRGTHIIAQKLLKEAGVDLSNTTLLNIGSIESATALRKGEIQAAMFLTAPDDPVVKELAMDPNIKLMNIDQAEAISRLNPALHHLILPHGALNLAEDIPRTNVHMVSSTATLLVRDDLHPALAYLMLKAASQVHGEPDIFEHRGEFPTNKDDAFPLSDDAKQYYKSGGPFWQRYLPFWLAAWFDRFILLVIPVMAFVLPMLRAIPRIYQWRIRTKIYQRYGELKFLENQIKASTTPMERAHIDEQLNDIEERVNNMKVPANFTEYVYSLRGHIHFVRERLAESHPG